MLKTLLTNNIAYHMFLAVAITWQVSIENSHDWQEALVASFPDEQSGRKIKDKLGHKPVLEIQPNCATQYDKAVLN